MQYTAYTVSITNGTNIVIGATGTLFLSKVKAGNTFKIKGDPVVYQVSSIVSDTELTLSTLFVGTTATNSQYQITTDFTPNLGLAEISVGDQDWPTHLTVEVIRKLDTAVSAAAAGKIFKGTWDASSNIPTIPIAATENTGWYYIVNVDGFSTIEGISEWYLGDTLISTGSVWCRVPTADTEAAVSADTATIAALEANASAVAADDSAVAAEGFLVAMAAATTVTTQNFGDVGTVGVELPYARQDHKHAMPATTKDKTANSGILKGNGTDVSPAVAGTDYLAPTGSATALTNFPTLNQNTTGSAAKLTAPKKINGVDFDGTLDITINAVDATTRIASSEKGVANGVATLDSSGTVPASQLPSYVDDVLEFAFIADFPTTGESGKIYLDADTNITYRWTGTSYVPIGSDLALGTTSSSAFRGDYGETAYNHSQTAHAPSTAEQNVQVDWNQTNSGLDDFIKNKPTLGTAAATNATAYVAAVSTPKITTSAVAPAAPVTNEIWVDQTDSGVGYMIGTTAGTIAAGNDSRLVASGLHVPASTGVHGVTGNVVGTSDAQVLTNKTLTSPTISSIINTGTITLPTTTCTLVGKDANGAVSFGAVTATDLQITTSGPTASSRYKAESDSGSISLWSFGSAYVYPLFAGKSGLYCNGAGANNSFTLWRDAVTLLFVPHNSTNVLIGTTTDTGAKLQVNGGITASTPAATSRTTDVSTTIWVKDQLRATVEAASGGRATVLYTAAGNPSYMNIIPAFNKEDISANCGTGRHEAFIVNGVNKSEIFYGTYPGIVVGSEFVSQPMVHPSVSRNFDTFRIAAAANGAGWHLVSNAERAAVALWCWKNGFQPRGNNNYGRDITNTWETARRTDGLMPGVASGDGATLTGSGPVSWRHDNSATGISDMNGNVWEWATGMRINAGEIQVLADNNAADNTKDVSTTSTLWQAIDGSTGALVAPGSANTVRYAKAGTTAYTLVCGSGAAFEGMTNPGTTPVSAAALAKLTSLGMYPVAASGLGTDTFYLDVAGERVPLFGGYWHYSDGAGVFALALYYPRSNVGTGIGARPAYVL